MTFRESINAIPYAPSQPSATGLLAPIIRAMGHILYVAATAADPNTALADAEAINELTEAKVHLLGTLAVVHNAPLSEVGKTAILNWVDAVNAANDEWNDWPADERPSSLKDLANRCAALAALLDLELVGLRNSDPGSSL